MKNAILAPILIVLAWTTASADMCGDIRNTFINQLDRLKIDTDAALSTTTDSSQIEAIRASYQMQYQQLTAQEEAALLSAGCLTDGTTTDGNTPPPTDGTTNPPTDGTTNPPTDGTTNPPTDGTTDPNDPGTVTPPPAQLGCSEQDIETLRLARANGMTVRQLQDELRKRNCKPSGRYKNDVDQQGNGMTDHYGRKPGVGSKSHR